MRGLNIKIGKNNAKHNKRWRASGFAVMLAILSGCGERAATPLSNTAAAASGTEPSAAVLTTLSGDRLSREQLRGRWLLVNYWAEWCKPCVEEIPELNQFAQLNADEVLVLGVNYDGATGAELRRQVQKLQLEFAVVLGDPAEWLGLPKPEVLPATHVLDKSGRYRKTLVGPQTRATLAAALAGSGE